MRNIQVPQRTVVGDLIKIEMGCTNPVLDSESACQIEGHSWEPDIHITTLAHDIEIQLPGSESKTIFQTAADVLEMPSMDETWELQVSSLPLTFSGVSSEWLRRVQEYTWTGRVVSFYRVFLDTDTLEVVSGPFNYYKGRVTATKFSKDYGVESGFFPVELVVSNDFFKIEQQLGYQANEHSHQRYFPGDTGLRHSSSTPKEVLWGKTS